MAAPLLSIDNLTVQFRGDRGWITAVEDVSFDIAEGESLGVVGESGSGKSVTALSILRLHRARRGALSPRARSATPAATSCARAERDLRRLRGRDIAMVFQDPMSSLNPVLTICDQICEPLRLHQGLSRADARRRAIELLDLVRIPDAARRVDEYPHRLSGGMRQRVMIAIAIACRAAPADRRRADHRARRDDPGADPRTAARSARRARHGGDADLARPRRDRRIRPPRHRHVCRPRRRGRAGRRPVPPRRAIPTPRA